MLGRPFRRYEIKKKAKGEKLRKVKLTYATNTNIKRLHRRELFVKLKKNEKGGKRRLT